MDDAQRDAVLALAAEMPQLVRDAARGADTLAVPCRDCGAYRGDTCRVETKPRGGVDGVTTTITRRRAPHDTRMWDARWDAIATDLAGKLRHAVGGDT